MAVKLFQRTATGWGNHHPGHYQCRRAHTEPASGGAPAARTFTNLFFIPAIILMANNSKGFYPEVEIQFTITDDSHYHVPLLINPYGYFHIQGQLGISQSEKSKPEALPGFAFAVPFLLNQVPYLKK